VPITFIEREYGDSKMSQRIVLEALVLTTAWGVSHRLGQLKSIAQRWRRPGQPLSS
jgi:dolichol-phosphate mannosyltransferase